MLDSDVKYTDIDSKMNHLQWGREVFGISDAQNFLHGDVLDMPFKNDAFDVVMVNLFHFFPRIDDAMEEEALRVANELVIWRTSIGEVSYMVRILRNDSFKEVGILDPSREDIGGTCYMLYSESYLRELCEELGWNIRFIERDDDFDEFDNTEVEDFKDAIGTKVVDGKQINGNLLLDWHYVAIDA